MSKILSLVLAASLLAFPFATFAVDYGSQSPQQPSPPVAQPLVREGDFAIKLAPELGLGSPSDEAAAENLLAEAGVSPVNGWISDYPVTPEIIGQLNESIVQAASAGKLPVGYEEAQQKVTNLAQQLSLPLPATGGTQEAQTAPVPGEINNYYSTEGPPVVTYYPPPPYYGYLYDWVPYPTVWFGFAFPGFFICHQFTRVVPVSPFFAPHHFHNTVIVTNRVVNPVTRHSAFVEHTFRAGRTSVAPQTMLRAETGRTFRSMNEFRGVGSMTARPGLPNAQPAPRTFAQQAPTRSFNAPPRTFGGPMNRGQMIAPRAPAPAPPMRSFGGGRAAGGFGRMGGGHMGGGGRR